MPSSTVRCWFSMFATVAKVTGNPDPFELIRHAHVEAFCRLPFDQRHKALRVSFEDRSVRVNALQHGG